MYRSSRGPSLTAVRFLCLQIDQSTARDKQVTVSGPTPEIVQAAVREINGLVAVDATPGNGEVSEAVDCPVGIVGRIIGRGGETIRGLQLASQAHIAVNQVRPLGLNAFQLPLGFTRRRQKLAVLDASSCAIRV